MTAKRIKGGRDAERRRQAELQAAYRLRLSAKRVPEADDVDGAIVRVVRTEIDRAANLPRGEAGAEARGFARRLLRNVVDDLEKRNFSRDAAKKAIIRRLEVGQIRAVPKPLVNEHEFDDVIPPS